MDKKNTITKLDHYIEIVGGGNVRKALAQAILANEQLLEKAAQQGVHWTGLEFGGFCELHDVVFYGKSCPLCAAHQ